MKALHELSLQEYNMLKELGMLWEIFPEATGFVNDDLDAVVVYKDVNLQTGKACLFYDIIDEEAEYEW